MITPINYRWETKTQTLDQEMLLFSEACNGLGFSVLGSVVSLHFINTYMYTTIPHTKKQTKQPHKQQKQQTTKPNQIFQSLNQPSKQTTKQQKQEKKKQNIKSV